MGKITFKLIDKSGLPASTATLWVAGWINGGAASLGVLTSQGTFAQGQENVPFLEVTKLGEISLDQTTNGDDRLLFVVSKDRPAPLSITKQNPIPWTQYPSLKAPGIAAPGPFDIFEFGMDAQFDLSAVNGFGLNLRFDVFPATSVQPKNQPPVMSFGVDQAVSRATIADAFKAFIINEAKTLEPAKHFACLLYDTPLENGTYQPPLIDGQFFGLCDPNDWLAAVSENYTGTTTAPLANFWDETLADFFKIGNHLSINLGSDAAPVLFEGACDAYEKTGTTAFTLTGPSDETYEIVCPEAGLQSAQYVFQQAFGPLTPAGSAGNAGLLQDQIWQALCRGVAQDGIRTTRPANPKDKGYSTKAWNDAKHWYPQGKASHVYAKFLHCADNKGEDSRKSQRPPIFLMGAAYGFSMDERPAGPYDGPDVPSKTPFNISEGTVTITLGRWT